MALVALEQRGSLEGEGCHLPSSPPLPISSGNAGGGVKSASPPSPSPGCPVICPTFTGSGELSCEAVSPQAVPTLTRPQGPLPRRPSPAQLLDLQIFPSSSIMARRWLRSPRMRNTFMAQPAGAAQPTRGTFRRGGAATSPAAPGARARPASRALPAAPPRAPAGVTWPGRREPGSAAARGPPPARPGPDPAPSGRGGRRRSGPTRAPRRRCPGRWPRVRALPPQDPGPPGGDPGQASGPSEHRCREKWKVKGRVPAGRPKSPPRW